MGDKQPNHLFGAYMLVRVFLRRKVDTGEEGTKGNQVGIKTAHKDSSSDGQPSRRRRRTGRERIPEG